MGVARNKHFSGCSWRESDSSRTRVAEAADRPPSPIRHLCISSSARLAQLETMPNYGLQASPYWYAPAIPPDIGGGRIPEQRGTAPVCGWCLCKCPCGITCGHRNRCLLPVIGVWSRSPHYRGLNLGSRS